MPQITQIYEPAGLSICCHLHFLSMIFNDKSPLKANVKLFGPFSDTIEHIRTQRIASEQGFAVLRY